MSEIKQSADPEMMRKLTRDICRELYRFTMRGKPQDAHIWLEGVLNQFGLLIRQQTAARCAEITDQHDCDEGVCGCMDIGATIRAEFEVPART